MWISGDLIFNCLRRPRYSISKYVLKTNENYWEVSDFLLTELVYVVS